MDRMDPHRLIEAIEHFVPVCDQKKGQEIHENQKWFFIDRVLDCLMLSTGCAYAYALSLALSLPIVQICVGLLIANVGQMKVNVTKNRVVEEVTVWVSWLLYLSIPSAVLLLSICWEFFSDNWFWYKNSDIKLGRDCIHHNVS